MTTLPRRTFLTATAGAVGAAALGSGQARASRAHAGGPQTGGLSRRLGELEQRHDVRIGLYAKALRTGQEIAWRADDPFLILSVFKAYAAAAVTSGRLITPDRDVLTRRVHLPPAAVVEGPTWFADHIAHGYAPTVAEVCEAAIGLSDNTAGNHLLTLIGGPAGLNAFARSCGDRRTHLTQWEPELNITGSANTTTPRAVGNGIARLLTGDVVAPRQRRLVRGWMTNHTTSKDRFRAALPKGWTLADKTGSGVDASANDVGVAFSPSGQPYLLSMLTSSTRPDTEREQSIFADAARWSLERLHRGR